MFKTNILTTRMLTILRMLSALVLISPVSYIKYPNMHEILAIGVALSCVPGFRYLFQISETSPKFKSILVSYLAPASIAIILLYLLNTYNIDGDAQKDYKNKQDYINISALFSYEDWLQKRESSSTAAPSGSTNTGATV